MSDPASHSRRKFGEQRVWGLKAVVRLEILSFTIQALAKSSKMFVVILFLTTLATGIGADSYSSSSSYASTPSYGSSYDSSYYYPTTTTPAPPLRLVTVQVNL